MKRSGRHYLYSLIFSLFLLHIAMPCGLAQVSSISGTINDYSKVTALGADWVELSDNTPGFAAGQKVLLIQMKGAELSVGGSGFGSSISDKVGDYGYYEFIVIDNVAATTITFKNNIRGSYNAESYVQLVKLPQYENVSIDGILSCPAWDEASGTGGVLTFLADNNVYLNSDIDVSVKGFEGGVSDEIQGLAITTAGVDPDLLDFTEAVNKAARKGKGVGSHITPATLFSYNDYARGKGRFGSGGGGGNGEFAGGGGGSSYGTGGQGGADLAGSYGAGYPGEDPNTIWVTSKYNPILMGGGGGAGGRGAGGSDEGSDGGRGGGIIIILADTIFGNGHSIVANGESVSAIAVNNGGAGGGGAAGAIVISASYKASSPLTITADGGNGGNTYNFDGFGGGGSGGLIFTNKDLASFGVGSSVEPGEEGATNYSGSSSGLPSGFTGQVSDSLLIRLNGFLFNTIVSDVTKSRVDSICDGDSAPLIVGTNPVGGLAPYTFEWQKRTDSGAWNLLAETTKDLDLTVAETDTIYLRRIVKDSSPTQIIDTSKAVMIIVQPPITGNLVGYDTIICFNQNPDALLPVDILGGGNFDSGFGDSTFTWHSSPVNNADYHLWATAVNINNERLYDPPALNDTIYYYRAVQSGRCYDTSNIVTVTVLPSIAGNAIGADQVICEDRLFTDLSETSTLSGGDGSYSYEWRLSTDDIVYNTAVGTVDQAGYNPDEAATTRDVDQLYRRFVWSGADNVCLDSSNVVTLKMWSDITGNTIYSDQTITQYGLIAQLTGDPLGGSDPGAGFTYLWEQSPDNLAWVPGTETNDGEFYQPVGLADTTWYRRIAWRAECTDTSNVIVINVHPAITNNIISTQSGTKDTIICNNQDPRILIGSQPTGGDEVLYIYRWEKSTDNINFTDADGIIINQDYDPPVLTQTTYFRRHVTSGESTGISDTVTVTVLADITGNNIGGDQIICYNTPLQVNIEGLDLLSGGNGVYTYLWYESADNIDWSNPAAGSNTDASYVPPVNPTVPMYYRRHVSSGFAECCTSISNTIFVDIYDLPIGSITGISAANSCAGDAVTISLDMSAAGQAPYDVVLDDGNGGTLAFTADADIFDYTFNPSSTGEFTDYTYQFNTLTDFNACVATDKTGTGNLRVYTVPTATISASTADEVCGLGVTLLAEPSVGTGLWTSPDATILSASAATAATNDITVQDYGPFTFKWTETNWTCTDETTIEVTFDEQPAPVDAGLGATLVPLTRSFSLNADPNSVTLTDRAYSLWTTVPGGGSQEFDSDSDYATTVRNLTDGLNILKWTVGNGVCNEESDTIMLDVTTMVVPNAFSPNNDGYNDKFEIVGLYQEGVDYNTDVKAELVITDMAGVVVYSNPDYRNDWDGISTVNGNKYLPDGTYYYFIRIRVPEERQYKGYVIIKRSSGRD